MTKRYYEAAVVAEHVARRYPSFEWAAKAADLAMQSLVEAYNTFTAGNRAADLDRLVSTWPGTPPRPGPTPSRGTRAG